MLRSAAFAACLLTALTACRQQAPVELHGTRSGQEIRDTWTADRKRETEHFTDADLQKMVDRLFIDADPNRENFHGLLYAERRPVPYLIRALDDPRTWSTVFKHEGFDISGNSPFQRICMLLEETAPVEAVKPLKRFLDHPDPTFRYQAAAALATIGSADCVEPVKRALADKNHDVRAYTLIGLANGVKHQHADAVFLRGIFDTVAPMLDTDRYDVEGPANVLMAIDPARGASILQLPGHFNTENPQLYKVLEALNNERTRVPLSLTRPLLAQLERLSSHDQRYEPDYAAALTLYARNPDTLAEGQFRQLIHSSSSRVAIAAAQGLELVGGIDAADAVESAYLQRGFAAMSKPQQRYHLVKDYLDEVENGGHEQYFYNSFSNQYEAAIEALKTIGATEKAYILADSTRAFFPLQPNADNEIRRKQMAEFGEQQDLVFKGADKRFFDSEERPAERVEVLLSLYALKYKSDFTPVPGTPRKEKTPPATKPDSGAPLY